jgi:hypothetical protein
LSSDGETTYPSEPDAPANQKVPAGDDAGENGATLPIQPLKVHLVPHPDFGGLMTNN